MTHDQEGDMIRYLEFYCPCILLEEEWQSGPITYTAWCKYFRRETVIRIGLIINVPPHRRKNRTVAALKYSFRCGELCLLGSKDQVLPGDGDTSQSPKCCFLITKTGRRISTEL
jgi:hypothetical protein